MKSSLKPGLTHKIKLIVENNMGTHFLPNSSTPVYATPFMIYQMEDTCLHMLEPHLDVNEQSVGTLVNVKHIAPTPVGSTVISKAILINVIKNRCIFHVESFDDYEKIGEGVHERIIIDVNRFDKRVTSKTK
tara:strand:+ start:355 stop:750 length:396 start_codon:yes stop_codon:yes gene_type:complete